jgi:hypothetical protein
MISECVSKSCAFFVLSGHDGDNVLHASRDFPYVYGEPDENPSLIQEDPRFFGKVLTLIVANFPSSVTALALHGTVIPGEELTEVRDLKLRDGGALTSIGLQRRENGRVGNRLNGVAHARRHGDEEPERRQ